FLLIVFWASTLNAQYNPGNIYSGANNYIEYHVGNLPIIISAPHGGTVEPTTIPDRTCSSCTTVKDSWTEELAYEIDSAIRVVFGGYPHIIINKLSRKKLDANREIVEAAQGNIEAETAWNEYHTYIQAAKDSIIKQYGSAIYIDLHAHGHTKQRIELGYLLSRSELLMSNATLNISNFQDTSSIKYLKNNLNPLTSFSDLLRGSHCMGELLHNRGYPSVPSATDLSPLPTDKYFNGGYNTARHGSRDSTQINAIQFETNYTGIRNNNKNRNDFARGLTCVLRSYLDRWYFNLDSWDPGNIVINNSNSGPGSLRSVLLGAGNNDTITFSSALIGDTIRLLNELQFCSNIVIKGPGANSLAISGQNNSRILRVLPSNSVEISGISFNNGKSPKGEDGGAAYVAGNLTLRNCIFANNFAEDDGGAIVISDSVAMVQLDSCIIVNNSCGDDGGAIRCWKGNLLMNATTVKDNASPSYGGAISMNGIAMITNSTFSNNSATTEGGAIRNFDGGMLTCTNSTFSGNVSSYRGAGISSASSVNLNFCTIVNNVASNRGGGIRLTTGGNCFLRNTLIANNTGSSRSDVYQFSGTFHSSGNNFIGDSTGSSINSMNLDQFGNSIAPINPLILPLASNGGNTETVALVAGSPCIDAADSSLAPNTDQIGTSRINNGLPDIGAYEVQLFTKIIKSFTHRNIEDQVNIYPNPARDQITIYLKNRGNYQVVIRNSLGMIINRLYLNSTLFKSLDISNYSKGIYWAHITGDLFGTEIFIVE
ncbi:MAG: T9SS type A sorting domain-containing protein, partial [Flavobacteriales bacterium]|nr:T9SS type A sorting domain-containing protein [Flavobacteriales bacterium]